MYIYDSLLQSAEALAVNGLTQQTCLVLVSLYSTDNVVNPQAAPQKVSPATSNIVIFLFQ